MAESIVTLRVNTTQATKALQGVQTKTTKLQGAFGALKTAIVGVGLTALAKQAVSTSTNFEKLNVRLGLLTKKRRPELQMLSESPFNKSKSTKKVLIYLIQ